MSAGDGGWSPARKEPDSSETGDPGSGSGARAGDLVALQAQLGIPFRKPAHLRVATTHRSYLNEADDPGLRDNERLEFLGDALVDFVAADFLFRTLPEEREGRLTSLRAALVRESTLGRFAASLDLGDFLLMGKGEEQSGGRVRPAVLCDAFEALVGAIFLDQGFLPAEDFVMRFLPQELDRVLAQAKVKDAKSRFQEFAQRLFQQTPKYVTVAAEGPDHDREFTVEVVVLDRSWGRGSGKSKALAAQAAAAEALERSDEHLRALGMLTLSGDESEDDA